MKATVPYIQDKFEEFNRLMFNGSLPMPPMGLSRSTRMLGMCAYKRKRNFWGKTIYYDFSVRINAKMDLPENEMEDIIIHEMIHYYIVYNQITDTSVHGEYFREMMNEINAKYGRHITISHKSDEAFKEQLADSKPRWHVVAVIRFNYGEIGLKVLPRDDRRVRIYCGYMKYSPGFSTIELNLTNNLFFNRYPCSSALKYYLIEENTLLENLKNAERLFLY